MLLLLSLVKKMSEIGATAKYLHNCAKLKKVKFCMNLSLDIFDAKCVLGGYRIPYIEDRDIADEIVSRVLCHKSLSRRLGYCTDPASVTVAKGSLGTLKEVVGRTVG